MRRFRKPLHADHGGGGLFFIPPFSKGAFSGGSPFLFVLAGEGASLSFFSFFYISILFLLSLLRGEGILFFLSVKGIAPLRISFSLLLFFSGGGLLTHHSLRYGSFVKRMIYSIIIILSPWLTPWFAHNDLRIDTFIQLACVFLV